MPSYFFKIAYRNLWRSKGFSAINIIGLAIGMASAIIMLLWIQNELGYDQFHEKKGRIYEVWLAMHKWLQGYGYRMANDYI